MKDLWIDFLRGFKALARQPAYAGAATLALGLGIGAASAIFSVVDAVLLRPLPFESPQRLVLVWERELRQGLDRMYASPPNYADWVSQNSSFQSLSAYSNRNYFIGGEESVLKVRGTRSTASLFEVLGAPAALGRTFVPEEEGRGTASVVVLSHRLWQSRFGGDPSVLNTRILLNEAPHTVIGVMPPSFDFPPAMPLEGNVPNEKSDLWIPYEFVMSEGQRGAHFMTVIGRLFPGVSPQRAQDDMASLAKRLEEAYPNSNAGWDIVVLPLREELVAGLRSELLLLFGAVGLLLLIACVNVANLLLARSTARQREFALRSALGAGKGRLIRQLVAESQALALVGGGLGLLLASAGTSLLLSLAPPNLPRIQEASLDWRVALFALLIALITGTAFGLAPALQSFKPRLAEGLREGDRSASEGRGGLNLRSALVVVEVALSILLLVGAGLLFRSFLALMQVDTGFQAEQVLTARLTLPTSRYPERSQQTAAYRQLEALLQTAPGVAQAGFIYDLPLAADRQGTSFLFEGEGKVDPSENRQINFSFATPGYFETMRIRLHNGRFFDAQDQAGSEGVALINQAMAKRFFPDRDPVGQVIVFGFRPTSIRIVGVVGDVRHNTLREAPTPTAYLPYYQIPWSSSMSLAVRSQLPASQGLSAARAAVETFDRSIPFYDIKTMGEIRSEAAGQQRFSVILLIVFSVMALLLASVGIYGVISYSVSRRTRETGIRMVFGARADDILRLVLRQGLGLTLVGIALGLAASLASTRWLSSLLFGVGAADPWTYLGVSLLLLSIAFLGCLIPARRATAVDPMLALRSE